MIDPFENHKNVWERRAEVIAAGKVRRAKAHTPVVKVIKLGKEIPKDRVYKTYKELYEGEVK